MCGVEMGECVAVLPPEEFLEVFFPGTPEVSGATLRRIRRDLTKVNIAPIETEAELCRPLCDVWNTALEGTGYIVNGTTDRIEDAWVNPGHKYDLALYYDRGPGKEAREAEISKARNRANAERSRHTAKIAMAWGIALVKVNINSQDDSFEPHEVLDLQSGSYRFRAHLPEYAVESFLSQHRECFYMAFVTGPLARFTRWDHCGVVVTSAFDWTASVDRLVNLFYKIATSSRAMQGFDTSISLAADKENAELARYRVKLRTQGDQRRLKFVETMMENENLCPIYHLNCKATIDGPPNSFAHEVHGQIITLLIGTYHVYNYSPTSRGTKGYFAYVIGHERLVFLKLGWRPSSSDIDPEHKTYERLYAERVENIPQIIAGGDVYHYGDEGPGRRLCTRTQEFLSGSKPLKRYAYRLIIETLGLPLTEYRDTWEMFRIVGHAVIAHRQAYCQADILHRDISAGNILIELDSADTEKPSGLLSDWDLSKTKDKLQKATRIGRTGTWAFMSGLSLRYPLKPQDVSDDLESFVNVIYFNVLRFCRHDMTSTIYWGANPQDVGYNQDLARFVSNFFFDEYQYYSIQGTLWTGGRSKEQAYNLPELPFTLRESPQGEKQIMLAIVLEELHLICHEHYLFIDADELMKYRPPAVCSAEDDQAQPATSPMLTDEQAKAAAERLILRLSKNQVASAPVRPSSDSLADHTRLEELFNTIMDDPNGWLRDDKTPDQFESLPSLTLTLD